MIKRRYSSFFVACLLAVSAPAAAQHLAWYSGFEDGFPSSEWLNYDNGSYSPDGALRAGRASGWTVVNRTSGEPVFAGRQAYKGWIASRSTENHRAYPVIHADIPTPLINSFVVYLDADFARIAKGSWIQLATWGNHDPQSQTGIWALHTMAVRDRRLEFAHVSPFHGEYIGPKPIPAFPVRRWVRLTVYLAYQGTTGFVQAWQDGVPMVRGKVRRLSEHPGSSLRTAHWGMYASGALDHGTQYNDEISICTLDAPLRDLVKEPRCSPRAN